MADNYLEKKMEEHRQGVRPVFRRSPSGNKPHTFAMPCNIRAAFIVGDEQLDDILLACAVTLRDTSCRVAFCCTDRSFGSSTAQKHGLRYYPVSDKDYAAVNRAIEQANASLGNIDVVLSRDQNIITADIFGNKCRIEIGQDCPAKAVATAIVYLTLPQSVSLGLKGNFVLSGEGDLSIVEDR